MKSGKPSKMAKKISKPKQNGQEKLKLTNPKTPPESIKLSLTLSMQALPIR
jgi:hypothetical protein